MNIEVVYRSGCRNIFESSKLEALGSDTLMVEYELSCDAIESDGLWLSVRHHDARSNATDPVEDEPEASRLLGWRLWLAAADEADEIIGVSIDDKPVAARLGECLFQTARIDALAEMLLAGAESLPIVSKIAALDECLAAVEGTHAPSKRDEVHAKFIGISVDALRMAKSIEAALHSNEISEDDSDSADF